MTINDYDWQRDAYMCWAFAISLLRKQGIIERRFDPQTEQERCWWFGP